MTKIEIRIYIRTVGFPSIERTMTLMLDDFTEASLLSVWPTRLQLGNIKVGNIHDRGGHRDINPLRGAENQ